MQEPNNKASLGCGTLILIALIVMIFGNANRGDDKQLKNEVRTLQAEVTSLKSQIQDQSKILNEINQSLKDFNKYSPVPRPRIVVHSTPEAPLPEN